MDPKVLLDFINVWYEDPNTHIDDLKLPPGDSHMVATFINEAKWKEQKAKQAKIAKARKEKFLRQNVLKLTREALVSTQAELQVLTDKCEKLSDRTSIKRNFIKLATSAVDDYNRRHPPPAPTPQPLVEQPKDASPVEEEISQAEEQHQERRADEPAIEEIITETSPDETTNPDETATDPAASPKQADDYVPAGSSLPAEESVKKTPSPKTSKVKKLIPSASDAKKTRAAEKEAKKRKASSAEEKIEAKRLKETEESADRTRPQPHIPPKKITETSAATTDESASTTKSADENQAEENVQSEQAPPTEQADQTAQAEKDEEIPQPDAQLEQEILHPEETAEENVPAPDNEFIVLNPESAMVVYPPIPQHNLNPVQRLPFSKRPKFQKEKFFEERMYFIGENPYDKPQMRHLKFWTRTQMNYYASVLCGRNKMFQRRHVPHAELEEIPCMEPILSVLHDAEPDAYSSWDDTETRPPSPVPPRVLNTRELLLSIHQKVDHNHKWVKCQFGAIVKTLTETQNSVKLNHHYLHEVFDRTWATLAHLRTQTELEELNFEQDFDWSWPPKKKFRPIPVPDLEDSSFSSFRTAESDEEQLDTATGPRKKTTPKKRQGSSSTAKK
ncbi:hypothetical protein ZWY2020_038376 [Hordeum vulgare]|nr:hypothetical protein ZWY2020_038376 [Hordeum vulgare]